MELVVNKRTYVKPIRKNGGSDCDPTVGIPVRPSCTVSRLPSFNPQQSIGPWRIIKELGRGGMGRVFLAEAESGRQVAIKVLRANPKAENNLLLFENERRIMAGLRHPNIVTKLAAGETEEGFPYILMEYVPGTPITTWCQEQNLTIGERLNLFKKVCHVVSFLHRNGVLHLDLKPGNILITPDGEPKIIDFGISRRLCPEQGKAFPVTEQRLMTPKYASPEQESGGAVTEAGDVYALGVILGELLGETSLCTRENVTCERHCLAEIHSLKRLATHIDPESRHISVASLKHAIDRLLRTLPVAAKHRVVSLEKKSRWAFPTVDLHQFPKKKAQMRRFSFGDGHRKHQSARFESRFHG